MKKHISEFILRGLVACGFGPLVLVVIYLILQQCASVRLLPVEEVCAGIVSLSALAFVVGGMNVIYRVERLPLMVAILIHGGVLYVSYLAAYLLNGWLQTGMMPFLIFSVIFVVGYLIIWGIIYCMTKRKTQKLNALLQRRQASETR